LPTRAWGAFMKSVYGEEGRPREQLDTETSEANKEENQDADIREELDEVSDYGPIAPAHKDETEDEFERLVNQVAG